MELNKLHEIVSNNLDMTGEMILQKYNQQLLEPSEEYNTFLTYAKKLKEISDKEGSFCIKAEQRDNIFLIKFSNLKIVERSQTTKDIVFCDFVSITFVDEKFSRDSRIYIEHANGLDLYDYYKKDKNFQLSSVAEFDDIMKNYEKITNLISQ